MGVEPVSFGVEHKALLYHAKFLLENKYVQIHPLFDKLIITTLRSAWAKDEVLDKEVTSHHDILDAFRLTLRPLKNSRQCNNNEDRLMTYNNHKESSKRIDAKSMTELLSLSIETRFPLIYLPILHCFSNECSCLVLCKLASSCKLIDEILLLNLVFILSRQCIENFDEHLQL